MLVETTVSSISSQGSIEQEKLNLELELRGTGTCQRR